MRILILLTGVLLAACTSTPDIATLSGTVSYRERIALPPGSQLQVTLEDTSRADAPATVLGEFHETVSAQVPLPFSIAYAPADVQPNHRYSLRARLTDADGRLLFISDTHIPVLGPNDPSGPIAIPVVAAKRSPDASLPSGQTFLFECRDGEFVARSGPGELAVWLDEEYHVLSQVPSGSGSKYQEGDIIVWMKGEQALIESPLLNAKDCRNNRQRAIWAEAQRRGVVFRATGNEPGWVLELHPQHMQLRLQDGHEKMAALPPAQRHRGITQYDASDDEGTFRAELENKRCNDSMADITYTTRVTVTLGDRTFSGCGNWLQ